MLLGILGILNHHQRPGLHSEPFIESLDPLAVDDLVIG
jgi:hypothetical protein